MSNEWDRYLGKTIMVQLRTQPYIGITGEQLEPVGNNEGYGTSPLLRGDVTDVWQADGETMLEIQTTDPNLNLVNNKVTILLNAKRDVGYVTVIESSKIQMAQAIPQQPQA